MDDFGLVHVGGDALDNMLLTREQANTLLVACAGAPCTVVTNTRERLIDAGDLPQWLGRSVDEMTGRPFMDFIHADDRRLSVDALRVPDRHVLTVFANRWLDSARKYRTLVWVSDHWNRGVGASRVYLGDKLQRDAMDILDAEFSARKQLGISSVLWHGQEVMPSEARVVVDSLRTMSGRAERLLSSLQSMFDDQESRGRIREAL